MIGIGWRKRWDSFSAIIETGSLMVLLLVLLWGKNGASRPDYLSQLSRWNCLFRAWKRYRRYKGRVRESMAAGCPERFDWEFIRWILWDGRKGQTGHTHRTVNQTYPDKFVSPRIKTTGCVFKQSNKRLEILTQPQIRQSHIKTSFGEYGRQRTSTKLNQDTKGVCG